MRIDIAGSPIIPTEREYSRPKSESQDLAEGEAELDVDKHG